MTGALSANGGLHHEHDDASPLPQTFGAHELAAALVEERNATRAAYGALAESVQSLHAAHKASDAAHERMHQAILTAVRNNSDATLAIRAEVSAMGKHVQNLAAKADLSALGAQVGRQALDSIAEDARLAADVKRVRALAVVRKGAFAVGVAAGTALALEWRAALKALVSLFGG